MTHHYITINHVGPKVLHPPLFTALTTSFLRLWPSPDADGVAPSTAEIARMARALAAQRAVVACNGGGVSPG